MEEKTKSTRGGYRPNSGRKPRGASLGLGNETIRFSVSFPVEMEKWVMSQSGKNRNDKVINIIFDLMKRDEFFSK